MLRWAVYCIALLLLATTARGAGFSPETTEVSVVTLGPGRLVYERFGHIGIHLRDEQAGIDYLVDWGNFDFDEPNFIGKFVKGSLLYSLDIKHADQWIEFYKTQQDRTVIEQVLSLDTQQKARLIELVARNEKDPKYLYDYYRDNCATRVRDILDTTTDGQFKANWTESTPHSFRWHTRRLMDVGIENKAMSLLIDLSCGPEVDRPLTKWELGFVPMELSALLDSVQLRAGDGALRPLVRERRTIHSTKSPGNAEPRMPPAMWPWSLSVGLPWGLLTWFCASRFRIGFWILAGIWSAFAAFATAFFVVIIGFTRHWVVDWNLNFLHFSPISIAILLAVLVPRLRRTLRPLPFIATGLSIAGLLITISPITIQQAAPAAALAIPMHVAVMMGWKSSKPKDADHAAAMPIA